MNSNKFGKPQGGVGRGNRATGTTDPKNTDEHAGFVGTRLKEQPLAKKEKRKYFNKKWHRLGVRVK